MLLSEIEKLENEEHNELNHNVINSKQKELLELRENKMKGHYVRTRAQWLQEGKKPSSFFVHLKKEIM